MSGRQLVVRRRWAVCPWSYLLRRKLSKAAEASETASVLRFPRSFTSAICRARRGLMGRTVVFVMAMCPLPSDKAGTMELPSPTATTLFMASTLSNSITGLGTFPANASHSITVRHKADCGLPNIRGMLDMKAGVTEAPALGHLDECLELIETNATHHHKTRLSFPSK
jgi:hypothetical protein